MKKTDLPSILLSFVLIIVFTSSPAFAWIDNTHLAIVKVTGYEKWYNAAGADIAKIKAGNIEKFNHHFNNNNNAEITPALVLAQVSRYNDANEPEGHLYGAILAALKEYNSSTIGKKYAEYHIAYCAHYIGDLSNPLHNVSYDELTKSSHLTNDSIIDAEVLDNLPRIKEKMYPVILRPDNFEADLAGEIARIASISRQLGLKMKSKNRDMTKEEAYIQIGHSASLLQAVLKHLGKIK